MCLLKNTSILLPSFHKNMKMQYFCCILRMFLEDYSELYCYLLPGNLYCMGKNSVSWGHPVNANKMNKTLWSGNLPKKRKPITSTEAMIYIHILFWYEGHTLKFILFISPPYILYQLFQYFYTIIGDFFIGVKRPHIIDIPMSKHPRGCF